ncbi:DUF86 domain-containing protein [Candidatus Saccharibacteria bacterium]|nr:DUF86 domain-containing protein [Candidatus Saccharibacteria bacterium]
MASSDKILIETIASYCETLMLALCNYSINKETIAGNLAFRGMVAFFVQQVGECAKKLSQEFKVNNPEIDWRAMSGLRNRIAHAYGRIDIEILWDVVEHDIPVLLEFCKTALKNEDSAADNIAA